MQFTEILREIYLRPASAGTEAYSALLNPVIALLEQEEARVRPHDRLDLAGGLLRLQPDLPTLIIPDLHARMDFFYSIFEYEFMPGTTVAAAMQEGSIQILCLGDGFHAEKRAFKRWQNALREFSHGYRQHKAIDAEMRESLGLMEMVIQAKLAYPEQFHFLRGNHENILNENADGNYAFRKFAFEGDMVREWVRLFYGDDFLNLYARFEKCLPLFAVGKRFLASHAEPAEYYNEEDIVNFRDNPELVSGLIWTDNDAAEEDSVQIMLSRYLPDYPDSVYFGGHRTISGRFRLRAGNRFVQIHNPDRFNAAWVMPDRAFDPTGDIGEITDASGDLVAAWLDSD
ncbi:MAG: metallophosphoesterase [Spirochaetes bacterium]|nr:metallophosphoesterase [Spirochaetota bacterium]MBU0954385.1 metallophosphoesterase [Spirochaetota bacterium]